MPFDAASDAVPVPLAMLPQGPLAPSQACQQHHAVWELLEAVTDPEIPVVNLREMGILRAVRQGPQGLEVVITPTYSGCPAMGQMEHDVAHALSQAGVLARVVVQLAPAWSTDWMTPEGREKLRAYGIAPPAKSACAAAAGAQVLAFAPRKGLVERETVPCPQCGCDNTTEISHFGSTACKALYRCLQCMEPFDYFKPYCTTTNGAITMTTSPRFHHLRIAQISPEAAGSVAIAFSVPDDLLERFDFRPGQYLTLRSQIQGVDVRRSYSICSSHSHLQRRRELVVGIRPMEGGVFSNWAVSSLQEGDTLSVMPPEGRFVSNRPRAIHRVAFAAGSGITPILSIMASTLEDQPTSKFTLVYGNRSMNSVMFNEALQDLKDRFPDRLTLIHILSRQAQEVDLLQGRIDAAKVQSIIDTLLPVGSMDEVFICGPERMIEVTHKALLAAGVPDRQIHTERFTSPVLEALSPQARQAAVANLKRPVGGQIALTVVLDGKSHALHMGADEYVLDVAMAAGLDLPFSCKGGVCATCRCKVLSGSVAMEKNFGLERWETEKGFVLSCQSRPTCEAVTISFDER